MIPYPLFVIYRHTKTGLDESSPVLVVSLLGRTGMFNPKLLVLQLRIHQSTADEFQPVMVAVG